MFYTIYKVTHKDSGKFYIGKHQTKNLNDGYMGSGKLLNLAKEKYGLEAFEKEILHVFDNEEEMNFKEAELVTEEFCSQNDTYNLCAGGHGGWGYVNSNNLRIGFSNYLGTEKNIKINRKNGTKTGAKNIRQAYLDGKVSFDNFKGKFHSEETKLIMSKIAKERLKDPTKNSQYGTMWITNGQESKKIKKDQQIPDGWRKGRKIK